MTPDPMASDPGKVKSRVPGWTDRIQIHSLSDRVLDFLPEMLNSTRAGLPTGMIYIFILTAYTVLEYLDGLSLMY
jgi:hypothetical protein